MAPVLQFRLWLREAPRAERQVTALLAALTVVFAATVLPTLLADAGQQALAMMTSQDGQVAGTEATSGAAPGNLPGQSAEGQPVGPGGKQAGRLTNGGLLSSSAGAATAGRTGAGTGSGQLAGGSGQAVPGQVRQPLAATDRGVTASSVSIGFVLATLGGINQAGVAADTRTDVSQVVDAIVDDANKHGGMAGRSVAAVKSTIDVTNPDSQRQGCLDLTQTARVFAVVDPGALSTPAGRSCVTVENKTPLLTMLYPGGSDEFAADAPNLLALSPNDNRRVQTWVSAAKQTGFFDPAKGFQKIGLLTDACEPTVIDAQDGLKAALKAAGVPTWSEFRMDCDVSSQQREAPSAVLQFRQDGVTSVFLASNTIADKTFTQSAQAQAFTPKYFLSDFWALLNDVNTKLLQQNQIDGAYGVSAFNHGDPLSFPAVKRCSDVLVAHGLAAIVSFSHDFEAIIACDHLNMVVKAGNAVGSQLTRPRFAAAVQSSGVSTPGWVHADTFTGPGKSSGGDEVQILQWSMSCTCWNPHGAYTANN